MANPYKSWRHDLIDTLIFLDITIISSISIMIRFQLTDEYNGSILALLYAQLFFIYLPALSFVMIIISKLIGTKYLLKIMSSSSRSVGEQVTTSMTTSTDSQSHTMISSISPVELKQPLLIEHTLQEEYTTSF